MSILGTIAAVINGGADAAVFGCSGDGMVQICANSDGSVHIETDAIMPEWHMNTYGLYESDVDAPAAEVAVLAQSLGATNVQSVITDWSS